MQLKIVIRVLAVLVWIVVTANKHSESDGFLNLQEAERLAALPLKCLQQEYPNKLNQTLADASELAGPMELHPAFYGCFDWHSSVHGHWMLIRLLKMYPGLEQDSLIRQKLAENITAKNIAVEVEYFNRPHEKSWERTYGWAWLLKLAEELHTWNDPMARTLEANLEPLTSTIVQMYLDFLIRSGWVSIRIPLSGWLLLGIMPAQPEMKS